MSALAYAGAVTGSMCRCSGCGHTFGGEKGFDLHRVGSYAEPGQFHSSRRCRSSDELKTTGMVQDKRGIWIRPYR